MGESVSEWASTRGGQEIRLEIEGVMKSGRAKELRKLAKPKRRCDALHSKKGGKGRAGKGTIKVKTHFQFGKNTHTTPT